MRRYKLEVRRVGYIDSQGFEKIIGDMSLWNEEGKMKDVTPALLELKNHSEIEECIILQKCNSIEFYVVTTKSEKIDTLIYNVWMHHSRYFHENVYRKNLEKYSSEDAIKHLFETTCGVKSVILGDTQVRGQVWNAYQHAKNLNCAGIFLTSLFEYARKVDQTVNIKTNFHRGYTSIERCTVEYIRKNYRPDTHIAVFGAGSSGQLIFKSLSEAGFKKVYVFSREPTLAEKIKNIPYKIYKYADVSQRLKPCEIIIAATDSSEYLLTQDNINILNKELTIFDISTPPVIDLELQNKRIMVYNISDVQKFAEETITIRRKELGKVRTIIGNACREFKNYLQQQLVGEFITQQLSDKERYIIKKPIFIIKSEILQNIREYLRSKEFIEVNTPLISVIPIEITGDISSQFEINWYGKKGLLRASSQYYKDFLIMNGFEKIYEISPFWRKLDHPSKNSLCESWAVDAEMVKSEIETIIELLEEMILVTIDNIFKKESQILREFGLRKSSYPKRLIKITFSEAKKYLEDYDVNISDEEAFTKFIPLLTNYIEKNYGTEIYFVTNFPRNSSRFYEKNIDKSTSTRFNLIY